MNTLTFPLAGAVSLSAASGGDGRQGRGPTPNGYAPADAPTLSALPKELKPVWKISIGGGFSSPVLAGNKLAFLDESDGKEVAHVIEAGSGKEIWRVPYANVF